MAISPINLVGATSTASVASLATTASVNATVAARSWLLVVIAADNAGTSGASAISSVVDSGGVNVYTQRALINYSPTSAANDGTTLAIYTCEVTSDLASATITVSFSPNVPAVCFSVSRLDPGTGESISFVSADTTGTTGTGTSHAAPTVSVTSGDWIYCATAIEGNDTVTGDADTTNGSWSSTGLTTRVADTTVDATSQRLAHQSKTVNATGNQSWTGTTAASLDSAQTYAIFRATQTDIAVTDLANGTAVDTTTIPTGATVTAATATSDFLLVICAADNQGASGVADITSCSDSGGSNTYTQQAKINFTPGAANGDGATLAIYTCPVTANITSGTISVGRPGGVGLGAIQVYLVRPPPGKTISVVAVDTTGSTGSTTSFAAATVSVTAADVIFGAASIETDDAITGDSDTTNGSWSTIVTRLNDVGTDANAQTNSSQYKLATATGNQSWACTGGTARDSARTYIILRASSSAKSIVPDVGSYALTGTDATTRRNLPMVADAGSYALTGTDVTQRRGLSVVADPGSYALTGSDASGLHKWLVDATTASSYALTGSDVALPHGLFVAADPGSYALAGTDATLRRSLPLTAEAGSYSLLGTDASLFHAWKLDATAPGSYTLVGTDVALTTAANKQISANAGTYSLTGTDATLTLLSNNKTIVADPGSYALTGSDAATTHAWKLDATIAGAYSLVGATANTLHGWKVDATVAASYALSGTDASLPHSLELDATVAASYTLSGTDAALIHGWELDASIPGHYMSAGSDVSSIHGSMVAATAGIYSLDGAEADLLLLTEGALALVASPGDYLLTGADVTLTYVPIEVIPEIQLLRGEWPEKGRKERRRKRPEVTAREDLRVALDRIYDGGEYDAPVEALEEAATKARAAVNVLTKLPNIPLIEVRAAEDLIRSIQEMLRQRVLEEEQALNDVAVEIARQHLVDTIIIADEVYRRTRQNYLLKTLLLIAE